MRSHFGRVCSLTRALCLSLCVTACGDRAPVEVEAARTRAPQPQQPYEAALDVSFITVGSVVPTFAEAYFGEDGALVIRLTDLTDSAKALSELEGLLLNRVRVDPSKVSEARKRELAVPRQWRFEKASHSFAELHQVRSQMFLRAFEDDDVVSLDIDERRGRRSRVAAWRRSVQGGRLDMRGDSGARGQAFRARCA